MVEARILTKLRWLSSEYIEFYLCWSILAEKLAVTLTMDLVTDITTGAKRSAMPDTLNLLLPFWSLFWTFLLLLYIDWPYGHDVVFIYPDYNPVLTILIRNGLIIIFLQVLSYQVEWCLPWMWIYCLNIPWLRPEFWRSWGDYPLNTLSFIFVGAYWLKNLLLLWLWT